ncbi:hypothetical protein [Terriglobus tenax]|uniref:hypothetical protein n=1 Tax=Terriglobus tenax TaxID=1111115 RepID=UPI0021E0F851|nr:hypothetical protein [Terriglobus tenax]
MQAIRDAGYEGVQFHDPLHGPELDEALTLGLGAAMTGHINCAQDAIRLATEARLAGLECISVGVGTGLEEDDAAVRLIESVLNASAKYSVPLYVETRRATLFQDMWRAVHFHRRFPALEFNGDFSHWYTGQEMVFGGFEEKLAFLLPLLGCVRFLHGRIGDSETMQIDLGNGDISLHPDIAHFRALWKRVFTGFLTAEGTKQPFLTFAPELLPPRNLPMDAPEPFNRWQQSLLLCSIAKECFTEAVQELGRPSADAVKRVRRTA